MAIITNKNTLPGTLGVAIYNLKQLLKLAGWTVIESSDGVSPFVINNGDTITSGAAGAGGFANSRAWFRIRMGGGATREFTFQWIGATSLRIKYSAGGFTAGGAAITTTPAGSAGPPADNNVILGGGTDAVAPTGGDLLGTINRVSYWADDAAPYGWGMHGWSAVGANTFGLIMDAFKAGTYPAGDLEPYVVWVGANTAIYPTTSTIVGDHKCGWYARGTGSAAFMTVGNGPPIIQYNNISSFDSIPSGKSLSVNPWTSKDDNLPVFYMRNSTLSSPGYRGVSNYIQLTSIIRANLSTQTITTPLDRLVLGWLSFPWGSDGVAPLL